MKRKSICVSCGKAKSDPFKQCKKCGFVPETEYQMARSIIFSLRSPFMGSLTGFDKAVLSKLAKQVQSGRPYEFDPNEEQRVVGLYRQYLEQQVAKEKTAKWIKLLLLMIGFLVMAVYLWSRWSGLTR